MARRIPKERLKCYHSLITPSKLVREAFEKVAGYPASRQMRLTVRASSLAKANKITEEKGVCYGKAFARGFFSPSYSPLAVEKVEHSRAGIVLANYASTEYFSWEDLFNAPTK